MDEKDVISPQFGEYFQRRVLNRQSKPRTRDFGVAEDLMHQLSIGILHRQLAILVEVILDRVDDAGG